MEGDLNALGIVLVIVLTAAVLARYGAWPRSIRPVLKVAAVAFGLMLLAAIFLPDCYEGPGQPILIPLACLALISIFTKVNENCAIAAWAIGLSAFVCTFHANLLLETDTRYTGNPRMLSWYSRATTHDNLWRIRRDLDDVVEQDKREYPAGWFAEGPLHDWLPKEDLEYTKSRTVEIHPFWHSPLTGLYTKSYHSVYLWYPGGRLKDGLKRLEFRPR